MRKISADKISRIIASMCIEVNYLMDNEVIKALEKAHRRESLPIAKKILSYMIENANMASSKNIPICQDTGAVVIFMEIGQNVQITGGDINKAVNDGVIKGYEKGYLRKSMVENPCPSYRKNTGNNSPAILYTEIVPGNKIKINLAAKGAGSENMSSIKMFKPTAVWEEIEDFIADTVKKAGPNPCPPVIVGVGIGGTFEKCALLAKKAGLRNLNTNNENPKIASLEKKILKKINNLNIGPLGFGGKTTALSVHLETYPCHIASLPVAVNLNCFTYRHKEAEL
ncbi:fumarate hydratase [Candidatus Desantisbacteria bacterium]|nr:fumarate hydratase [Candidatus Desantisbacteria bacterium]